MGHRVVTRIVWLIVGMALAYTVWVVTSDTRRTLDTLKNFPWLVLPAILGAVLVNFTLRWVKWEYYRRAAGVKVPISGSFLVYFSGYSMAISPGRVGELIKPFMYREYFGIRMRRTIPLVLCERASDLLGMLVLTLVTMGAYASGVATARGADAGRGLTVPLIQAFLVLSVFLMVGGIVLARAKRSMYGLLALFARIKPLSGPVHKIRRLYFRTYPLLTVKNLVITTALAAVSWSFECIALDAILHGTGAPGVSLAEATFMFCMATIFGGLLFFMPGGAVGFEGSLAAMLAMLGVATATATTSVVLVRFCTLFFSVLLGFIFISVTAFRYHKRMMWEHFERGEAADTDADLPPPSEA